MVIKMYLFLGAVFRNGPATSKTILSMDCRPYVVALAHFRLHKFRTVSSVQFSDIFSVHPFSVSWTGFSLPPGVFLMGHQAAVAILPGLFSAALNILPGGVYLRSATPYVTPSANLYANGREQYTAHPVRLHVKRPSKPRYLAFLSPFVSSSSSLELLHQNDFPSRI